MRILKKMDKLFKLNTKLEDCIYEGYGNNIDLENIKLYISESLSTNLSYIVKNGLNDKFLMENLKKPLFMNIIAAFKLKENSTSFKGHLFYETSSGYSPYFCVFKEDEENNYLIICITYDEVVRGIYKSYNLGVCRLKTSSNMSWAFENKTK